MSNIQFFIWGAIDNATPIEYQIYITDMSLPTLSSPWNRVELGAGVYSFRRNTDNSKTFDISGYISYADMATTRYYAEDLNNSLMDNPSGRLVDGYGKTYDVYVNTWSIKPVPAVNKYTFSMNFTLVTL
jgi:hypothetical protein